MGGSRDSSPQEIAGWKSKIQVLYRSSWLNSVASTLVYSIPDIKSFLSLMVGSRCFPLLDIENAHSNNSIR
jgi:hypothetical protein